jgi:hypothetical protein
LPGCQKADGLNLEPAIEDRKDCFLSTDENVVTMIIRHGFHEFSRMTALLERLRERKSRSDSMSIAVELQSTDQTPGE